MTPQPKVFWIGLTIYLVSFLVPAVGGAAVLSGPALGFYCAFYSLFLAAGEIISMAHRDATIFGDTETLSLLASGLINILFLIAASMFLFGRSNRTHPVVLKFLVPLLFPFCWVVFHYEKLYPLFGYFLWMIGILMVLFSVKPVEEQDFGHPVAEI